RPRPKSLAIAANPCVAKVAAALQSTRVMTPPHPHECGHRDFVWRIVYSAGLGRHALSGRSRRVSAVRRSCLAHERGADLLVYPRARTHTLPQHGGGTSTNTVPLGLGSMTVLPPLVSRYTSAMPLKLHENHGTVCSVSVLGIGSKVYVSALG